MTSIKSICLLLAFLHVTVNASKILFLLPMATRSHQNVFDPLIEELATRGHDITVVTAIARTKAVKNIHEIVLDVKIDLSLITGLYKLLDIHPVVAFSQYKSFVLPYCEKYFQDPRIKDLIKSGQQFDTVIVNGFMNEFALTTAPLLGKTIILLSPVSILPWMRFFVPTPPSYVPNIMLPYTAKMSFLQRMHNVFTLVGQQLIFDYQLVPAVENVAFMSVPQALPVHEAMKKVDFVLTNLDPVLTTPRPTMPNIVNVGGMDCRDAKKLPKEFEDFINTSGDDGFILFSLGSMAQSKFLPPEKKEAFISALSKLKQKVIWKYEEKLDNIPPNVKITSWMPQQDLLGHPKCKLFITHGGRLSLQETIYHGVPVAAVPLFGDQPSNVARIKELEIGDRIDFDDITAAGIYSTIKTLLTDKKYSENMKKFSAIFKDQPQRPEKRAAFWVEYVIRHQGAKHFRSAGERLNFFQYFLLDVIGLLIVFVGISTWMSYKIVRLILCKFCKLKKCKAAKKVDETKKNE